MKNAKLIWVLLFMVSCNPKTEKNKIVNSDTLLAKKMVEKNSKVDMRISLKDTVLNYGDKILLDISLTNNSSEVQKLLFDKPAISTDGPWATSGFVTDIKTKLSVLKYCNKAVLSSNIYAEHELKDKYYFLKLGQTISGQYELTDIVVFNNSENLLPKGTYEVQLYYDFNPSNVLTIKIK